MKRPSILLTLCSALCLTASVSAQDAPAALAERLVELRGQVDELQGDMEVRREEHKNRMVYLTAQLADVEANRDREELRVNQVQEQLEKITGEIAAAGVGSDSLLPFVLEQIATLRSQVASGFPFKIGERMAELDELQSQLTTGAITAQRGVNRLWAFIEDEFRISRENAIYTQSIPLNGVNVLVDVAKLGNAMMFFRTRDLEYGRAAYANGNWRFEILESAAEQELVARLFDSLRKQIRQGYFDLPAALPPMTEAG